MNATRYIVSLLLISLSCQTKPKQESGEKSVATEDTVAALTKRPAADAPRSAADRLVRALYFEHNKQENPFREDKDRSLIDQFFAKPTADLVWNSRRPSKANLLFNAPDKAIKKMWVEPAAVGGSRAVVYVTFQNNGRAEEIKIDMQQITTGRWRIVDMHYPTGERLTQLLK